MGKLPGRTWLVESPDPRGAQHALRGQPGVIALAQIGASLRMLAANEEGIEQRVAERLRSAGVEARLHAAAPNLEDVFVAATRRASRAA
jgi:ABC-2 type transport system ATP-binding protein